MTRRDGRELARRTGAAGLVLGPLVYLGMTLAAQTVPGHGDAFAVELQGISAAAGRWEGIAYASWAFPVLMLPATLAVARLVRDRRPWSGRVGSVLALLGVLGLAAHTLSYNVDYAVFADIARRGGDASAASDYLESYPPFNVILATVIIGTTAGWLVLSWALWRGRVISWWVAACIAAFPLTDLLAGGTVVARAGTVAWVVGLSAVAVALLRLPLDEWESPAATSVEAVPLPVA